MKGWTDQEVENTRPLPASLACTQGHIHKYHIITRYHREAKLLSALQGYYNMHNIFNDRTKPYNAHQKQVFLQQQHNKQT